MFWTRGRVSKVSLVRLQREQLTDWIKVLCIFPWKIWTKASAVFTGRNCLSCQWQALEKWDWKCQWTCGTNSVVTQTFEISASDFMVRVLSWRTGVTGGWGDVRACWKGGVLFISLSLQFLYSQATAWLPCSFLSIFIKDHSLVFSGLFCSSTE